MNRWTCPKCKRDFGRRNQGHMCSPGLTLEQFFADAHERERPIFEVVRDHLVAQGDVIVDPISIGILFKHGPMLCELRTMKKWVALGFFLRRRLASGRLSRKVTEYQGKYFHVINISDVTELDDEILEWLTEAYHAAAGKAPPESSHGSSEGGMVPDDIDDPFD